MKRTSTLSVFATTCAVLLALSFLYAIGLCIYHGNLMYLRLWRNALTIAWIAAPVVLLFSVLVAFAINSFAKRRQGD